MPQPAIAGTVSGIRGGRYHWARRPVLKFP